MRRPGAHFRALVRQRCCVHWLRRLGLGAAGICGVGVVRSLRVSAHPANVSRSPRRIYQPARIACRLAFAVPETTAWPCPKVLGQWQCWRRISQATRPVWWWQSCYRSRRPCCIRPTLTRSDSATGPVGASSVTRLACTHVVGVEARHIVTPESSAEGVAALLCDPTQPCSLESRVRAKRTPRARLRTGLAPTRASVCRGTVKAQAVAIVTPAAGAAASCELRSRHAGTRRVSWRRESRHGRACWGHLRAGTPDGCQ